MEEPMKCSHFNNQGCGIGKQTLSNLQRGNGWLSWTGWATQSRHEIPFGLDMVKIPKGERGFDDRIEHALSLSSVNLWISHCASSGSFKMRFFKSAWYTASVKLSWQSSRMTLISEGLDGTGLT